MPPAAEESSFMRRLFGILALAFAGAFFVPCFGVEKTEKLKLVAAYRLDGAWFFRIFDGRSGDVITVKQGARNGRGFAVENYDEPTQTAVVSTPYGNFIVSFKQSEAQVPDVAAPAAQAANPPAPEQPDDASEQSAGTVKTVSRARILENIK